MCETLTHILSGVPSQHRGASALARYLSADRPTCQRIVQTVQKPDAGAVSLLSLPGVDGIRNFIKACQVCNLNADVLDAAEAAVSEYERLISEAGGSHAKLCRKIAGEGDSAARCMNVDSFAKLQGDVNEFQWRRHLYDSAKLVTGRWFTSTWTIFIYNIVPGNPDSVDRAMVTACFGHVSTAKAPPFVIRLGRDTERQHEAFDGRKLNEGGAALLEEFCSRPLPRLVLQGEGSRCLNHVIEPASAGMESRLIDIAIANRIADPLPHPRLNDPPREETWNLMSYPTESMVLDVFLHRDLARVSLPSVETHLWSPSTLDSAWDRWMTRLPHAPQLQVLGPGVENITHPPKPQYSGLVQHLFNLTGWNSSEFYGYRCFEQYPIWRVGYCVVNDFSTGQDRIYDSQ